MLSKVTPAIVYIGGFGLEVVLPVPGVSTWPTILSEHVYVSMCCNAVTVPCLDAVDEEPYLNLLVPHLPNVGSGDEAVNEADDKAILLLAGKLLERRERD